MPNAEFVRRAAEAVVGRGHVTAAEIHQHGLRARDLSASNRVALVEVGSGRGFVVKALDAPHDPVQGSPLVERDLYRRAAASGLGVELLPELVEADDDLMIVRGMTSYRRLDQRRRGGGPLGTEGAAALGAALGRWHEAARALDVVDFWPWILDFEEERPAFVDGDPDLRATADDIGRRQPLFVELRRLRSDWLVTTVIHGDIRFANVLMGSTGDVRIVDWETAGRGDPRWDVAGAIQEYLSLGIGGSGENRGWPAVRALLDGYGRVGESWEWARLRPFVVWRILLRVLQLANWPGDVGEPMRQHLELAEVLVTDAHGATV